MMKPIAMHDDRVVGVVINGRIDDDAMEALWKDIEQRLTRHEKLRVYVELEKLGLIEPGALVEDLRKGFRDFTRFERKCVVTDAKWMRTLGELLDPLVPTMRVKAFSFDEIEAARAWVAEELEPINV